MSRSRPLLAVLVALAAVALVPSSTLAATTSQVVADCNAHGRLVQSYSDATLRNALATLPAEVAEYTDCPDVIRRQLLAQVSGAKPSGSGSGGGSSGSFLPTWVIALLIIVILGGAGATVAARRRSGGDGG